MRTCKCAAPDPHECIVHEHDKGVAHTRSTRDPCSYVAFVASCSCVHRWVARADGARKLQVECNNMYNHVVSRVASCSISGTMCANADGSHHFAILAPCSCNWSARPAPRRTRRHSCSSCCIVWHHICACRWVARSDGPRELQVEYNTM